jgi:hypothetical protein
VTIGAEDGWLRAAMEKPIPSRQRRKRLMAKRIKNMRVAPPGQDAIQHLTTPKVL